MLSRYFPGLIYAFIYHKLKKTGEVVLNFFCLCFVVDLASFELLPNIKMTAEGLKKLSSNQQG
jgi:phosphatidylserine synthase